MNLLLAAIDKGDEAQSALAAKALASVISGTQALQEVLLDAGGTDVLMRHLEAPEVPRADEDKGEAKRSCPYHTFAPERESYCFEHEHGRTAFATADSRRKGDIDACHACHCLCPDVLVMRLQHIGANRGS